MRKHLKGFFIAAALLPAYQAWAQAEVPIEGATSFYVWQNDVPRLFAITAWICGNSTHAQL